MLAYYVLFLVPAIAALIRAGRDQEPHRQTMPAWFILSAAVLIGLRHEVGGDWDAYLEHYQRAASSGFWDALLLGDPGYMLLNWLSAQVGGDIYLTNFLCGVIFMTGIAAFCAQQPRPWLALAVAVPYLIVVVAMGYSRQAVAIGLLLLAFNAMADGRMARALVWTVIAATMHKTAVVMAALLPLVTPGRWLAKILVTSAMAGVLPFFLTEDATDYFMTSYVDNQMQSAGALPRVLMNLLPALVALAMARRLFRAGNERRLWIVIALLCLGCLPLVEAASTAVDRMALYLSPIQMVVWSRVPLILHSATQRVLWATGIVAGYGVVLTVWLHFAHFAPWWIPYRMFPFAS